MTPAADLPSSSADRRRGLWAACVAHALHDGYTDSLYAFLPAWQVQFGLSYAGLAVVRALYFATMGGFQIPADRGLRPLRPRTALILSTIVAAAGLSFVALPLGLIGLCIGLVAAGLGSSVQHPRGSTLVSESYGREARRPLGVYNFAGDVGKAALPAAVALMLTIVGWQSAIALIAALGVVAAGVIAWICPATLSSTEIRSESNTGASKPGAFMLLTVVGGLDTATRMGYLLFLPFFVEARGGGSPTVGLALALLFSGGAFGKATCVRLQEQLGVVGSVVATELATSALIVMSLITPLPAMLVMLPVLGVVLNGTSSVLYGTVPDLASGDTSRAFAVFYTSVIVSGGLAPIVYGAIADHSNRVTGVLTAAVTALLVIPLIVGLRSSLSGKRAPEDAY